MVETATGLSSVDRLQNNFLWRKAIVHEPRVGQWTRDRDTHTSTSPLERCTVQRPPPVWIYVNMRGYTYVHCTLSPIVLQGYKLQHQTSGHRSPPSVLSLRCPDESTAFTPIRD